MRPLESRKRKCDGNSARLLKIFVLFILESRPVNDGEVETAWPESACTVFSEFRKEATQEIQGAKSIIVTRPDL